MAETSELQLNVKDHQEDHENQITNSSAGSRNLNYKWWIKMAIYMILMFAGQATGAMLGRLYYAQGGQSKWLSALLQTIGFPVLLPFYFISSSPYTNSTSNGGENQTKPPSILALSMVYITLGLLTAGGCYLTSCALSYLPISTLLIVMSSQLAFTSVFSFFLNSQKFTAFIINSVVLLTISSTLIAFQPDSSKLSGVSKAKQAIGFLCAVGASVGASFMLSLTQFFFRKVIRKQTFKAMLDVIIFSSLVATCLIMIGFFVSKEWKSLSKEMEVFGLGKVSYTMTLAWTAISYQLLQIGGLGLIFEVSSLFCNVMGALTLPLLQVLAVIIFHDKVNGVKVMAMILSIWGFVSYIYQLYLDDIKSKRAQENASSSSGERSGNDQQGI